MPLRDEALAYWNVCQKYRHSFSLVGRTLCASTEVPGVYMRSTNPRIRTQLSHIMNNQGVSHVEA